MKIKWRVQPRPTGRYRSFENRGWPEANLEDGRPIGRITCSEEYFPPNVKSGNHSALTLWIADYRITRGKFQWRRFKKTFTHLEDAKEALRDYVMEHPDVTTFCDSQLNIGEPQ